VFHLFNIAVTASILVVASLIHDASANHECDVANKGIGLFASQNFPNNYKNNQNCIQTFNVKAGKAVKLTFMYFQLEKSKECRADSVKIYDGPDSSYPLLATLCGFEHPAPVISSGNKMSLYFKTDASGNWMGFQGSYNTTDVPNAKIFDTPIVKIGDRVARCIDDVNDQSDGTVRQILSSDVDFILVRVEWDSQNFGDYNITKSMPRQCAEPEVLSNGGNGNNIETGVNLPVPNKNDLI